MKRSHWLAFSGVCLPLSFLHPVPARGTEEHLLRVFQPLATAPGIEVVEITYLTSFGALEETTIGAVTWPTWLDSPHEDRPKVNLNLAHRIGLQVRMKWDDERKQWRVTFDLTKLEPLPEAFKQERLEEAVGFAEVLQKSIEATERNLRAVGVFDCEFNVLAEESYAELQGLHIPPRLNRSHDVWGAWPYDRLQETYDEGQLHQLAARCLSDHARLSTIFLVASSESFDAEAESQLSDFLRELLARVGDDAFSKHLRSAEDEVRARVAALLTRGIDRTSLETFFPKSVSLLPSP